MLLPANLLWSGHRRRFNVSMFFCLWGGGPKSPPTYCYCERCAIGRLPVVGTLWRNMNIVQREPTPSQPGGKMERVGGIRTADNHKEVRVSERRDRRCREPEANWCMSLTVIRWCENVAFVIYLGPLTAFMQQNSRRRAVACHKQLHDVQLTDVVGISWNVPEVRLRGRYRSICWSTAAVLDENEVDANTVR